MAPSAAREEWWEREKSTWPNHELSAFVDAGGVRWHVQRTGQGPGLLLVHGTGASSHSWRDLIPALALHYTVVAADLPGHGFTAAVTTARRSIPGMSASMTALLRRLDFNPLFCVGHSAGAVILCRMALDRHIAPRAIISLNGAFLPLSGAAGVLLSPFAKVLAGNSLLPRLLARHADNHAAVARVLAGTGSQLDAPGIDLYRRLVRNPEHIAGALGMMASWDLRAFERELPRLATRLILVAADHDRTVPAVQALEIQRRIANAVVRSLTNLGHLAHEERPALVASEILEICGAYTEGA